MKWVKFERSITIEINEEDIEEVSFYHTGGNYQFELQWKGVKFKRSITINNFLMEIWIQGYVMKWTQWSLGNISYSGYVQSELDIVFRWAMWPTVLLFYIIINWNIFLFSIRRRTIFCLILTMVRSMEMMMKMQMKAQFTELTEWEESI